MTIKELHIGIDLGLQKINSNVFNKLLPEEKDYFLNVTIKELVRAALLDENNTVFNIVTYANIRSYYEALQQYIRTIELNIVQPSGERYVYGDFPVNIPLGNITSGVLYKGITYKVINAGSPAITLTGAGYTGTVSAGITFECNPADFTGGSVLVVGETYRIVNAAGQSFTGAGAPDNNPGTVFTCTTSITLDAIPSIVLERLTFLPTYTTGAILAPITNFGYFNYLSSESFVKYGQAINYGTLTVGKKYIVDTAGTLDLSAYGGKAVNSAGYIFTCTSDAAITWGTTGTILYEVVRSTNRIVKFQDVYNFLDNSYGTTVSSPIATLNNNKVNVYHDYKFKVYRLYLAYIKEPISVSKENNITTDLPVSLHAMLVDTTVKYIQSTFGASNSNQQSQNQQ